MAKYTGQSDKFEAILQLDGIISLSHLTTHRSGVELYIHQEVRIFLTKNNNGAKLLHEEAFMSNTHETSLLRC